MLVTFSSQEDLWNHWNTLHPQICFVRYPLLKRALDARHVHQSGTTSNKHYHETLLTDFTLMATIDGPNAERPSAVRLSIFSWIRNPNSDVVQWKEMPRGLGDDYTALDAKKPTPRSFLSLTRIQYALLEQWSGGNFKNDWLGSAPNVIPLDSPTPDDLDLSSVENCVGGPFYPGIEVSWLIRAKDLYAEPFRLNFSPQPESPDQAEFSSLVIGALKFKPGFFSQQMALPWQADFYDCHKESGWKDPDNNEYVFMWWTAQRPDDVFPAGTDEQQPWTRALVPAGQAFEDFEEDNIRFHQMQSKWMELKFLSQKRGNHFEEES